MVGTIAAFTAGAGSAAGAGAAVRDTGVEVGSFAGRRAGAGAAGFGVASAKGGTCSVINF